MPVESWYVQFTRPNPASVTKATLDEVSTERPIVVFSTDGHSAVANSKALALAGIDAALFPGSWSQWSNEPGRPVATGAEPGEPVPPAGR